MLEIVGADYVIEASMFFGGHQFDYFSGATDIVDFFNCMDQFVRYQRVPKRPAFQLLLIKNIKDPDVVSFAPGRKR
ncbi:hypothetical protein ASD50_16340 [Mesorhizobium sp. Root552]|nr:hypothetical protein ASD50_16340 [Mesorhizobium sp. Root552]